MTREKTGQLKLHGCLLWEAKLIVHGTLAFICTEE
jgi:hypothetical protein